MPTLLKLGADVTGQSKIEKFAEALNEVAQAASNVDVASKTSAGQIKTIASAMGGLAKDAKAAAGSIQASQAVLAGFKNSLDSIWAGGNKFKAFEKFKDDIALVGIELTQAERRLTDFITTSGRYAEIAKKNSLANYEVSAGLRAQEQAITSLLSIEGAYVNALAKEAVVNNRAAISLQTKTAAINANVAAYERLSALGVIGTGSYNKAFNYSEVEKNLKLIDEGIERHVSQLEKAEVAERAFRKAENEAIGRQMQGRYKFIDEGIERHVSQLEKAEVAERAFRKAENEAIGRQMQDRYKLIDEGIERHVSQLEKAEVAERALQRERNKAIADQMARRYASEDDYIEHHIATLKAAEAAERQYTSAANAAMAASMERNLRGREALRQGSYAVSAYAQSGRDALAAGAKTGGYDYQAQIKAEKELFDSAGKLKAQTNLLANAWDNAGKKASTFHNVIRGASGAMGGLWLTYGNIIPMIAGFAATASTVKSVHLGAEFDYMARSIQKLGGLKEGAENLELVKSAIFELSKDNVFSSNELAEGVLEFARAGKTAADAIKNLGEVSKFAYLGEIELSKATQLVVGQTSAFRGTSEAQAVNTMAVVADKTSISLQQMGEALKNTTSLGAVMGLEFDDVAIAIGQLGQSGIRGATAGAALTTMMYKLIEPTIKAQKAAHSLGVEFSAFDKSTGKIKSLRTIGDELNKATENLTKAQKASLFENLVGLRGIKALGALVDATQQGEEEFKNLKTAIDASNSALEGLGGKTYLSTMMSIVEESGKVQKSMLSAAFSDLFTKSYDNSSAVKAMKDLRAVVTDKDTIEALQTIVSLLLKLTELAAKAITITIDFAGGAFEDNANAAGASLGASLAAAVTFYFTKNLKLSMAAAAATTAGFGGAYKTSVSPDMAYLESSDEKADRIYAFNAAIKEQERVYTSAIAKVKEYASANNLLLEDLKSVDYNSKGGGFRVLLESAIKAQTKISELKSGLEKYTEAAVAAESATSKLTKQQLSLTKGFNNGEAATDFANLMSELEQIEIKVKEVNTNKLELIDQERQEALANYAAKTGKLQADFKGSSKEAAEFNDIIKKGKDLLNTLYDNKMADALRKGLKSMEQSWEDYTDYVIIANSKIAKSVRESLNAGFAGTGKDASVENFAAQMSSFYLKGLKGQYTKVEGVERDIMDAIIGSTGEFFKEQPGFEKAIASSEQLTNALITLGKTENDLYRNSSLTKAGYAALTDEQKKLADQTIDTAETQIKFGYASEMQKALGKDQKEITKEQRLELKQLTEGIKSFADQAKDSVDFTKDWNKDVNQSLKSMLALNDDFGKNMLSDLGKINYDFVKDISTAADEMERFNSYAATAGEELRLTGEWLGDIESELLAAKSALSSNMVGSSTEDINKVRSLQVVYNEMSEAYSEQKILVDNLKLAKEQLRFTDAASYEEARKAQAIYLTYEKISSGIGIASEKMFTSIQGNRNKENIANAELLLKDDSTVLQKYKDYISVLDEVSIAEARYRSGGSGANLISASFSKAKFDFENAEILDFYSSMLPNAIDDSSEAFSQFFRDVVEGNLSVGDSWKALGETVSDVIYDMMQDLMKMATKSTILGVFDAGTGGIGSWLSSLLPSAKGNVFQGVDSISALSNTVVTKPTIFPFATGGIVGEAGYEGVLPLSRMSSGNLGVEANIGGNVTVNVIEDKSKAGSVKKGVSNNGINTVDVYVAQIKASIARDIAQGNGQIPDALAGTYGLNRTAGRY